MPRAKKRSLLALPANELLEFEGSPIKEDRQLSATDILSYIPPNSVVFSLFARMSYSSIQGFLQYYRACPTQAGRKQLVSNYAAELVTAMQDYATRTLTPGFSATLPTAQQAKQWASFLVQVGNEECLASHFASELSFLHRLMQIIEARRDFASYVGKQRRKLKRSIDKDGLAYNYTQDLPPEER